MRTFKRTILAMATAGVMGLSAWVQADPLVVTTSSDATAMAQNLVGSGPGITLVAGSAHYTGAPNASGFFSGGTGIIGFDSGILLTTGNAPFVVGPNTTTSYSVNNGTSGDADLTALAGDPTFDASVLTFRFIPTADIISFQFVFGSEEYMEYVGSGFNDAFGFFLNGTNIALVPGTSDPITVNSVHSAVHNGYGSFGDRNADYFVKNIDPAPINTQLDGLVGAGKALYATGAVTKGVENTIKLAIADTSDHIWDCAVFLKASSFKPEPPPDSVPLPAAAWAGMALLGGLGAVKSLRRKA